MPARPLAWSQGHTFISTVDHPARTRGRRAPVPALCPLHLITADDFIPLVRLLSASSSSLLFFLSSLFACGRVYFYFHAHFKVVPTFSFFFFAKAAFVLNAVSGVFQGGSSQSAWFWWHNRRHLTTKSFFFTLGLYCKCYHIMVVTGQSFHVLHPRRKSCTFPWRPIVKYLTALHP